MSKQALKWVGDKYIPYELPEGASSYEQKMGKIVSCCSCGKKVRYGECYTSRQIHTEAGFGYAECEDCYYSYLRGGSEGK